MLRRCSRSPVPLLAGALLLPACSGGNDAATAAPPPVVSPDTAPPAAPVGDAEASVLETQALGDRVTATIEVDEPLWLGFSADAVWVPNDRSSTITRVDPATNEVVAEVVGVGRAPKEIAAGPDGRIWVASGAGPMTVIDPVTNAIVLELGAVYPHIATSPDGIWVTDRKDRVARLDPATGEELGAASFGDGAVDCNNFIEVAAGAVWVAHCDEMELLRLDPVTLEVTHRQAGYGDLIATDGERVVANGPDGPALIDPATGKVARLLLPLDDPALFAALQYGQSIGFHDGRLWVAGTRVLVSIDVATGQVGSVYGIDGVKPVLSSGAGSLWAGFVDQGLLLRLDL